MRILDRYIARGILGATLFAIPLLSLLLVFGNVYRQIHRILVEFGAPLSVLVDFTLSFLPLSLIYTIPWAFLASLLLVFGRMSSDNELGAFRAAGVSLLRLAAPVLAIGLGFSMLCLWINLNILPKTKTRTDRILRETIIKDPRVLLRSGMDQSRFPNVRVYSSADDGEVFRNFHAFLMREGDDSPSGYYIHAETAETINDEEQRKILLRFSNAFIDNAQPPSADPELRKKNNEEFTMLAQELQWMALDYSGDMRSEKIEPTALSNAELTRIIRDSAPLPPLDPAVTHTPEEIREHAIQNIIRKKFRTRCLIEKTDRYTSSFACLAFALIGIPLGIKARRRDTSSGLLLSLAIGAAYFSARVIIIGSASESQVLLLWVPNVACLLLGAILFRRARHR